MRVNDRFQVQDEHLAGELWTKTGLAEVVNGLAEELQNEEEGDEVEVNEAMRQEERAARIKEMNEIWGGEVVGLNPNIRIYRYGKGQFFDKHCKCISQAPPLV